LFIVDEMIDKAISLMKKGKAAGPSGVVLEIILGSQQLTLYQK